MGCQENPRDSITLYEILSSFKEQKLELQNSRVKLPMWQLVDRKLVYTPISSRISFRTNISKAILESLQIMAKETNNPVNYLLENSYQGGPK